MKNTCYRPKQSQYSHQVMTLSSIRNLFWNLSSTMTVTWKAHMKGVHPFFLHDFFCYLYDMTRIGKIISQT